MNQKTFKVIFYGFISVLFLGKGVGPSFSFTIENEVATQGLSTSLQKSNQRLLTEKKYKNQNEWYKLTLFDRFEKALKLYNWSYPSLRAFLEIMERGSLNKIKGEHNLASSWASSHFDPDLSSYLYQKKGWNCEGIHFLPGDIQELMTVFFPWEIGTKWGNQSVYGGGELNAHEFHEAVHFHLFTGEGLVMVDESKNLFYPILKAKSSFKELLPQELIPFMSQAVSRRTWLGNKVGKEGPAYFQSRFFKPYNSQGKKTIKVLKFIERGTNIIDQNKTLPYSELRGRILESPFFLSVFEEFEGQFRKYRTKKGLRNILNKLRFRYFKDALYKNIISFKDGVRAEKVTTKITIGKPASFRGGTLKKENLSLVYFLFQKKGQKGLNQKVAYWQDSWKKDVQKKLSFLKNVKAPYWDKYKGYLRKSLTKKWSLSHLGKKSNYFIMGSTWFSNVGKRPRMLFSIKTKSDYAINLASDYGQWFYDIWDKNKISSGSLLDLPRNSFYRFVGKGIGLRGLKHLSKNCRQL